MTQSKPAFDPAELWPKGSPKPDPEEIINKFAAALGVTQDAIIAAKKVVNSLPPANGDYHFQDLPDSALQGRLGEICFNKMADFPLAYAWPALLSAASVLIKERTTRTNLYVALVGPVASGKSKAIELAQHLLGVKEPILMDIFCGSAEQLARRTKDANGAPRLFSPDELSHLGEKMSIEGATFGSYICRAFDHNRNESLMGKKETAVADCALSIVGGIVTEKFDKMFNAISTGGLYDRFLFGYVQDDTSYEYFPFEEEPIFIEPTRVVVDREVWHAIAQWRKGHDSHDRSIQIALRAAVICASFDGRTSLTVEDLEPAYELARYQIMVRDMLRPNPGENIEGRVTHKLLDYLRRLGGQPIGKRELFTKTHAYDYGGSIAERALLTLKSNGEIEQVKHGKKFWVRLVTEAEHAAGTGPGEE